MKIKILNEDQNKHFDEFLGTILSTLTIWYFSYLS